MEGLPSEMVAQGAMEIEPEYDTGDIDFCSSNACAYLPYSMGSF